MGTLICLEVKLCVQMLRDVSKGVLSDPSPIVSAVSAAVDGRMDLDGFDYYAIRETRNTDLKELVC